MNDYILEPEPAYEPDLDAEADRHNQAWLDGLAVSDQECPPTTTEEDA